MGTRSRSPSCPTRDLGGADSARCDTHRPGVPCSRAADVAREAIERQLPPEPEPGALAFLAIGEGGPADVGH